MSKNNTKELEQTPEELTTEAEARRNFLMKAGRFAAVTPPTITLLLGTSLSSRAIAKSGGGGTHGQVGGGKGNNQPGIPGGLSVSPPASTPITFKSPIWMQREDRFSRENSDSKSTRSRW